MKPHVTRVTPLPPDAAVAECSCGWMSRVYSEVEVTEAKRQLPKLAHVAINVLSLAATAGQVHRWVLNWVDADE